MVEKYDLDAIIAEIGYFGRSQLFYTALILFLIFYVGIQTFPYVFIAGDLNYRCRIDECDSIPHLYNPVWLKYAVPFDKDGVLPEQCYKYMFIGSTDNNHVICPPSHFDNTTILKCDTFVYETDEETILTEFNLTCNENKWKLTLPGTLQNAGLLINFLVIGIISDRFGRRIVCIVSPILAAVVGVIQPFAWDYTIYSVLKFCESFLSGGTYAAGLLLVIELANPSHRVIIGTIIFMSAAAGKTFFGFTAMLLQNWKILTFVSYLPSLAAIAGIWIIPESVKWLLIKGRYKEIAQIVLRIIKWNKVEISSDLKEMLSKHPELLAQDSSENSENANEKRRYSIWDVFKSLSMLIRIAMLAFCFLTNLLVFYGLTLISTSIGGNKYATYMIAGILELPACILVLLISHRVGRKVIICTSYLTCGISLLIYPFVSDWYWSKFIVFMVGKFAITISHNTIYIFAMELLPTNLRQTLTGVCMAIGRSGTIIAPQAPLLEIVMKNLPMYLFSATALASGIFTFQFPETLNTKLPDTIDEALAIGN